MPDQTGDTALLAQILSTVQDVNANVQKVDADVTTLKVQVAQVVTDMQHGVRRMDGLERRVTNLEEAKNVQAVEATGYVTKDDLEESQNKRARRTAWIVGIILALITPIEAAIISRLLSS